MGYVAIFLLAAWYITSLLNHVPRFGWLVQRFDRLQFIPQWGFFAPLPLRFDYVLGVRDAACLGDFGRWQMLVPTVSRGLKAIVWNPGRRLNKRVLAATQDVLASSVRLRDEKAALDSNGYSCLREEAATLASGEGLRVFQFAVFRLSTTLDPPSSIVVRSQRCII